MYNESVSYHCHSVGLGWGFKIFGFRVAHSVAYPPEKFARHSSTMRGPKSALKLLVIYI